MNMFIKLVCISILVIAPAMAMDHRTGIEEPNAHAQKTPKARTKRNYVDEVWPKVDCLTPKDLAILKKARAEEPEENFGEFLIVAARDGNVRAIQELLWRGTSVNYRNSQNASTPLMYAAAKGHSACVEQLLIAGADVTAKNKKGKTALDYALQAGHNDLAARIEECLSDLRAQQALAQADLAQQIIMAVEQDDEVLVSELLEKGAPADNTALIKAAKYGHLACLEALLAANAEVNCTDLNNDTPLIWAAKMNRTPCVLALVEAEAKINHKNNRGKTALKIAKKNRNPKAVDAMKKKIEARSLRK